MMRYIIAAFLALVSCTSAFADITYTQGSGTTIFDFTCFTTKHCTSTVIINSAGTEILTSSNPGQVTGANGTFPATQSGTWNITNISGTVSLPTGAATSALQGTNSATTAHTCSVAGFSELGCLGQIDDDVKAAIPAGSNTIGKVDILGNAGANLDGATGSAVPANAVQIGGRGSGAAGAPVMTAPVVCDSWKPFSLASTTVLSLVAGVASKKVYVCSINLITSAAANVALIEGTKTTTECDTGAAGMAGGSTAATGWNLAANGGLSQGTGVGVIAATATAADEVCLASSNGSAQVSGVISYAQF